MTKANYILVIFFFQVVPEVYKHTVEKIGIFKIVWIFNANAKSIFTESKKLVLQEMFLFYSNNYSVLHNYLEVSLN